jgi:hypothetical protein
LEVTRSSNLALDFVNIKVRSFAAEMTSTQIKRCRGAPLPTLDFQSRVTLSDVETASLMLGASSTKFSSRLLIVLAALRRQAVEGDCLVNPPARLTATQISRDLRSSWEALRGIDPALCRARYVSLANAALVDSTIIDLDLPLELWEPYSSGGNSSSSNGVGGGHSGGGNGSGIVHSSVNSTSVNGDPTSIDRGVSNVVEKGEGFSNVAFSGWLLKKREKVTMLGNPWRARFCVVIGRQLRSYEGTESSAEEARDVFLLSPDVVIQGETVIGSNSSVSNSDGSNSGSGVAGGKGHLITDPAGKISIHKSVFPEGYEMNVITSSKPPEGVAERGMLAPISISQSGQTYLFATHGEGAIEDRERWLAALRASQFGALDGEEDQGDNKGALIGGKATSSSSSSSSSAPSFSSPIRTSLKVKDAKSLVLTTPRRPQSIRMAPLNDESSISVSGISINERRRSSALSNLEIAHLDTTTPRKNIHSISATTIDQAPSALSTPNQQKIQPTVLSSALRSSVVASSPSHGVTSTSSSSNLSSSSSSSSSSLSSTSSSSSSTSSSSSSSSLFVPAPLPSSPHLSSRIAQLQSLCRQKSVTRDLKSAGWDEAGATKNNGVTVYAALDGGASSRGDTFISHPRSAILTLITSIPSRKIIDERFDTGETIEAFGTSERPHTSIQHMTFYGIPPVSNRDYVTLTHWCLNEDGTIHVVSGSIEDKRCPEIYGVVRAELTLAAWVVRPRLISPETGEVDESKGCDVTYMNFTDLKGWVPMAIKRTVASQQALLVARVRDILDGGFLNGKPPLKPVVNVPFTSILQKESDEESVKSSSTTADSYQTPIKPRRLSIEKVVSTNGEQTSAREPTTASTQPSSASAMTTDRTALLEAEVARLQSVIEAMRMKELGLRRDLATLTMRFAGVSTSAGSSGLLKPGALFATQATPVFSLLASASLNVTKKEEEK